MNVLICIPCLLTGGTEIQTLSLVKALIDSGHSVVVACYFEYSPGMVENYERAGAKVYLMSPDGTRPQGISKIFLHLLKGFRKIIRKEHPEIVHVQYMTPASLAILALKMLGMRKIIATSHSDADIYSPTGLRIIRFLANHVLSGFQCITLLAEENYFGSSQLFDGTLTRHFTIYNSLPNHIPIRPTPREPYVDGEPLTIGVVSRLERIKGMDLVIPSFTRIAHEYPFTRLMIVGDGSLRPQMEEQANGSGFADRIEFVGRQPQSTLADWYDKIDILLMPSRSEGFGLTAIEGMARGCVPVVSNIGGLPEVVRDGIDGLNHTSESVDDITDKLSTLIDNSSLLNTLRFAVIYRARDFSHKLYLGKIAQLYSTLQP